MEKCDLVIDDIVQVNDYSYEEKFSQIFNSLKVNSPMEITNIKVLIPLDKPFTKKEVIDEEWKSELARIANDFISSMPSARRIK